MIFEFQDSSSKDDSRGFSFLDSIASFSLLEREAGDAMANWTWNFISPRMRGRPVAGRKESFPEECNIPAGQEDKECHPHAKLDTQMKFNMATRKSSLVAPPVYNLQRLSRARNVSCTYQRWYAIGGAWIASNGFMKPIQRRGFFMETVISHGQRYHPFPLDGEGIVAVFGDMVVWDCAQGIGILSRFVYPCEFDPSIDIVLRRRRSVISAISSLYTIYLEI